MFLAVEGQWPSRNPLVMTLVEVDTMNRRCLSFRNLRSRLRVWLVAACLAVASPFDKVTKAHSMEPTVFNHPVDLRLILKIAEQHSKKSVQRTSALFSVHCCARCLRDAVLLCLILLLWNWVKAFFSLDHMYYHSTSPRAVPKCDTRKPLL